MNPRGAHTLCQGYNPDCSTGRVSAGTSEAGVERVAERVAEEVEREDGGEDGDARPDAHPPLEVREVALRVVDVLAPRRIGRLGTEAEEGERRLGEDRERRRERRLHDERVREVREDVAEHDPDRERTDRARGDDEIALAERERVPPRDAR